MAQELDDGEFWLPSDFLTDEDLLTDFKPLKKSSDELFYQEFGIGNGNAVWSNSEMSSPVESVNGSTETESDEDEIITGLTRSLAQSTLQDSSFYSDYGAKGWKLSGSPQSTLCGCKKGSSSRGSPDCVSRVSSPPLARDAGWDLLCAAAGEVSRMRRIEDTPFYAPPPRPSPVSMPVNRPNSAASEGFYRNQVQTQAHLAYLQLQASQFQRMKEQQLIHSGLWSQSGKALPAARSQALSMAAWPTLQQSQQQRSQPQHSGSGMRAVFLGGSAAKKERTGTGVFLPRRLGINTSAPRKKPGFSTALLPDRVVHALNLNLESLDTPSHVRTQGNVTPEFNYDAAAATATATALKNNVPQRVMHQEFRLPQEWTY